MKRGKELEIPTSIEAEKAALSASIISPDAFADVMEVLGSDSSAFYADQHKLVYAGMLALYLDGRVVDPVTLVEQLKRDGTYDRVGASYLGDLISSAYTSANAAHYAQQVKHTYVLRQLLHSCQTIASETKGAIEDVPGFLDGVQARLYALFSTQERRPVVHIGECLPYALERLDERILGIRNVNGTPSGLLPLDEITTGWRAGELVIVAARPSHGKTAFALNLAFNAATAGTSTLFFSCEMAREEIVGRLTSIAHDVSWHAIRSNFNLKGEREKLLVAIEKLKKTNLHIDDTPGLTVWELRNKARRHVHQHGPSLILVDYLQLLEHGGKFEKRYLEMAAISRSLKSLARELACPVVACCQLSREADAERDPYAKLRYLRESGSIEQDADVVIILSGCSPEEAEARRQKKGTTIRYEDILNCCVAKHRNGPVGSVDLFFERRSQRIRPLNEPEPQRPPVREWQSDPDDDTEEDLF